MLLPRSEETKSRLCSFFVKEYNSYKGRNPRNGEMVDVVPKKLPFFKCGKELKERVDYS